jgi:hypothetical protein
MELLGDEAEIEARFGLFGGSANLDEVHGLRQTFHTLRNQFGRTQWYSYETRLKWKLVSFHLEMVLT